MIESIRYTDSDFASSKDPKDQRTSVSGYFTKCAGGPIDWSSKRQTITAGSSCEAEIIATHLASLQLTYVRRLLIEIGFKMNTPMALLIDNQASMKALNAPELTSKSKHFDVRYFRLKHLLKD